MFKWISKTGAGVSAFWRGIEWLKKHPSLLFLLFIPMMISLLILSYVWATLFEQREQILAWVLFAPPQHWLALILYTGFKWLVMLLLFIMAFVFCILGSNVLSSPVYDYVSLRVEQDITGKPIPEVTFLKSLALIFEELKKVGFILTLSITCLFIPGLGILSPLVTAFGSGWDLYDLVLARRGWTFKQRLSFVAEHSGHVLGLGVWMLIPFMQIIIAPLAVAGATILATEDITSKLNFKA